MKRNLLFIIVLVTSIWLTGEVLAGGPKGSQQRSASANFGARAGAIQRYWKPAVPVAPHHSSHFHPRHHYYYPYHHYGHNPRSIIVITPSFSYPYSAPVTIVTSEPYYCHMHHVGFVSRVGFLDHISGTHKIPLETATSICTEMNESCIIEGY